MLRRAACKGGSFLFEERYILVVVKNLKQFDPAIIILNASIGVFLTSLTQQCFCTTDSCGYSIAAVFSGAIGLLLGGAGITWLANPILLASWIWFKKKQHLSLIASFISTLISLSFLLFKDVMINEAGNYDQITSYKLGYWLWVLSSFIMFAGNVWLYFIKTKANKE